MKLPKIKENLIVQDLNNEVLIFDKSTNKSYCLNETAKIVFNACDGKKTLADVKLPEDVIYFSLDELKKNNLIEGDYVSPFAGITRREVIRKIGLASMVVLPLISSLVAPTAAQAQSQSTCAASGSCSCTFFSNTTAGAGCIVNGFGYTGNCSSTGASQCFACRTTATCNAGDVCPGVCSIN